MTFVSNIGYSIYGYYQNHEFDVGYGKKIKCFSISKVVGYD